MRREFLAVIREESRRLNRLLTNLLDFALPQRPEFQSVDVRRVTDSVVTLVYAAILPEYACELTLPSRPPLGNARDAKASLSIRGSGQSGMLFMRMAAGATCAELHRVSNPIIAILHHVHHDPSSGFQVSDLSRVIASGDRGFLIELHVHVALRRFDGQVVTLHFDHGPYDVLHAAMSKDLDCERQ
jgi:hypothetical protein